MIRALENLTPKEKIYVFLAGPMQGAPDWQNDVPDFGDDVELICPKGERSITDLTEENWKKQVDWGTMGLRMSDVVLFWISKRDRDVPGRDYAQTTKIELMECLARGKRVVLGIDPSVHTRRYMIEKYKQYFGESGEVYSDFYSTIKALEEEINKVREGSAETFFTSDTHFGQERTLLLSRRPFKDVDDMNWTMIERWNKKVSPRSTVFHLGDFGDYRYMKYLNGNIKLIAGNYEDSDFKKGLIPKDLVLLGGVKKIITEIDGKNLTIVMGHEPSKVKNILKFGELGLFGHIHGRQFIKKFGLDVGVDAYNFTPLSLEEVKFYLNAIIKGYYDDEVFLE